MPGGFARVAEGAKANSEDGGVVLGADQGGQVVWCADAATATTRDAFAVGGPPVPVELHDDVWV